MHTNSRVQSPLNQTLKRLFLPLNTPGPWRYWQAKFFCLKRINIHNVIACGSKDDPTFFIQEIDTRQPQAGRVKFQVLHSAAGQNSIDVYMGDTTMEKRLVSDLDYLVLSTPFEALDSDARADITVSKHSEEYNRDSVLLSSVYNEDIISGASYLSIVANFTFDPESELTFWLYLMPLE